MLVKTTELARLFGLSPRRINQLASEGVLHRTDAVHFDAVRSVRGYVEHVRGRATKRSDRAVLDEQKVRLISEQADAQAMKNAAFGARLLPAEAVAETWVEIVRRVRSGLLAVPGRAHQRLPHLSAEEIGELKKEIEEGLSVLGDGNEEAAAAPVSASRAASEARP